MMNVKRYAWWGLGLLVAAIVGPLLWADRPQKETYAEYYERCLNPQVHPFKRDQSCILDANNFRPILTTPEG